MRDDLKLAGMGAFLLSAMLLAGMLTLGVAPAKAGELPPLEATGLFRLVQGYKETLCPKTPTPESCRKDFDEYLQLVEMAYEERRQDPAHWKCGVLCNASEYKRRQLDSAWGKYYNPPSVPGQTARN